MDINNKKTVPSFAEEFIVRESKNDKIKTTQDAFESKQLISHDFNNLETLCLQSNPIKLPALCYESISNAGDTIPHLRYIKTLYNYGIVIIKLDYNDDGSTLEKIVRLIGVPHVHDSSKI